MLAGWTGKGVMTHETVVKRGVYICSSESAEKVDFFCVWTFFIEIVFSAVVFVFCEWVGPPSQAQQCHFLWVSVTGLSEGCIEHLFLVWLEIVWIPEESRAWSWLLE